MTHIPGTPFIGVNSPYYRAPGGYMGAFIAWDAAHGQARVGDQGEVSGVERRGRDGGRRGLLRHARWMVQGGGCARRTVLWKFKVGSGIVGNPITYRGPDGKQYVAVYAGIGGDWFLLSGDAASDDPADVRDPADYIRDLARYTSQGGMVWVFGFP